MPFATNADAVGRAAPLPAAQAAAKTVALLSRPYLDAVRRFADTVLDKGRDHYGAVHTPLFVEGLHTETFEPAV